MHPSDTDSPNQGLRVLVWRFQRILRRTIRVAVRRLHRDDLGDRIQTVIIAGVARSGTTWLGEILASPQPTRVMFEPFSARLVETYSRFPEFLYMRPEDENKELYQYCQRIFTGRIRHPWIDKQLNCLRPQIRLIKEVRVNLFLKWMVDRFPGIQTIMVIRHPCAVVHSWTQAGWTADSDLECLLAQRNFVDDFLRGKSSIIAKAQTPEEKLALIWCINYAIPLRQFGEGKLPAVFYEDLLLHPKTEIPRAFALAGISCPDSAVKAARHPSSTTKPSSPIVTGGDQLSFWQKGLSSQQVERILSVVESFGLDTLYGNSPEPRRAGRRLLLPRESWPAPQRTRKQYQPYK